MESPDASDASLGASVAPWPEAEAFIPADTRLTGFPRHYSGVWTLAARLRGTSQQDEARPSSCFLVVGANSAEWTRNHCPRFEVLTTRDLQGTSGGDSYPLKLPSHLVGSASSSPSKSEVGAKAFRNSSRAAASSPCVCADGGDPTARPLSPAIATVPTIQL